MLTKDLRVYQGDDIFDLRNRQSITSVVLRLNLRLQHISEQKQICSLYIF
jgi:hypothetical protein